MNKRTPTVREVNRTSVNAADAALEHLLARATAIEDSDPQQALRFANEALAMSLRERLVGRTAQSRRRLGHITWKLGLFEEALNHYKDGLALARRIRNRQLHASCVNGLGITLERLGDFETALICFERFIEIAGAEKDLRAFVAATTNIGRVLEQSERMDEAISLYKNALGRSDLQRVVGYPMIKLNLGVCFGMQKRFEESKVLLVQALGEFPADQPLNLILCRANLAQTLAALGEFDEALVTAKAGLQAAKEVGSKQLELRLLINLSEVMRMANRAEEAITYGEEANSLCAIVVDAELKKSTHETLANAYEASGDARNALLHYKQFSALRLNSLEAFWRRSAQQALHGSYKQIATLLSKKSRTPRHISGYAAKGSRTDSSSVTQNSSAVRSALSEREREVLTLLSKGESNGTIAESLGISLYTARYHVSSILNKLGVGKRAEAVAAGINRGLIA
jgi:tetratricopeptide (TPR) repeat protein